MTETEFEEVLPGRSYVRKGKRFVGHLESQVMCGVWSLYIREVSSTTKVLVTGPFYDCSESYEKFYSPDGTKHYSIETILESAEEILSKMGYD